jgi:uncharacterized membrane protein
MSHSPRDARLDASGRALQFSLMSLSQQSATSAPASAPHSRPRDTPTPAYSEPRWQAMLALAAIGGLHLALPRSLTVGPQWLLPVVAGAVLIPTIVARRRGYGRVNQVLGFLISSVITCDLVMTLVALVAALPTHAETPGALLRSGAVLWATNVLVFASWYWRLDAGGPNAREMRKAHAHGAFLFPQMTAESPDHAWRPGFVDYLFIAFNTSAAFSPTDTPVLSRWAKLLSMVQAAISFTTVAVLLARGVGIL